MGRPKVSFPKDFEVIYGKVKNKSITAVKAMEQLNLKKSTFYNLVV
jgi:hypothetical protein